MGKQNVFIIWISFYIRSNPSDNTKRHNLCELSCLGQADLRFLLQVSIWHGLSLMTQVTFAILLVYIVISEPEKDHAFIDVMLLYMTVGLL